MGVRAWSARRVLAAVAALLLVPGLLGVTASSASADPAGTITLMKGTSAYPASQSVLAASSAAVLVRRGEPTATVVVRAGVAPLTLPPEWSGGSDWLVGSLHVNSSYTGTVRYRDVTGAFAGSRTLAAGDQFLAGSATGWLVTVAGVDGTHLVRIAAQTGVRTDLGLVPGLSSGATGYVAAARADASGVVFVVYTGGDSTYRVVYRSFAGSTFTALGTIACCGFAVDLVGDQVVYASGLTITRVTTAGLPVATITRPAGAYVYRVAATATATSWAEYVWDGTTGVDRAFTAPKAGGTATAAGSPLTSGFVASTGSAFVADFDGLLGSAGVKSFASAAGPFTMVLAAASKPAEADAIAVSAGRVVWSDDQTAPVGVWRRSVSRSGSTFTAGAAQLLRKPGRVSELSASGRRVAYSTNGGAYVQLGSTAPVLVRANATALGLSGLRLLLRDSTGVKVRNLSTGAETVMPADGQDFALWGETVAYSKADGSVWVRSLADSSIKQISGATAGLWGPPQVQVSHDRVAWLACGDSNCRVRVRNFRTMTATVVMDSAEGFSLGSNYVLMEGGRWLAYRSLAGGAAQLLSTSSSRGVVEGSTAYLWDYSEKALKAAPLPALADPARLLGADAPKSSSAAAGPWMAEFVATKPLPTCSVLIKSGATVVRRLACANADGGAVVAWDGKDAAGVLVASGSYSWQLAASTADGPLRSADGSSTSFSGTITRT